MAERTTTLVLGYESVADGRVAAARWLMFWAFLNWAFATVLVAFAGWLALQLGDVHRLDGESAALVWLLLEVVLPVGLGLALWGSLCWWCRRSVLRGRIAAAWWAYVLCYVAVAGAWVAFAGGALLAMTYGDRELRLLALAPLIPLVVLSIAVGLTLRALQRRIRRRGMTA